MLQDLAALAAPVIVCVAFLVGAWAIVRRELVPKRRARTVVNEQSRDHADHEHGGS